MDIRAGNYCCSMDQEPVIYIEDQYSKVLWNALDLIFYFSFIYFSFDFIFLFLFLFLLGR